MMMAYEINLELPWNETVALQLDESTTIQELVDFIVDQKQILMPNKQRINIYSVSLNQQLDPKQTLKQILGNKHQDTFRLVLNQQSTIIENPVGNEISINIEYKDQIITIIKDRKITLKTLFLEQIQKNPVQMIWNYQNLSNYDQNLTLEDIDMKQGSTIQFVFQDLLSSGIIKGGSIEIEFEIEYNQQCHFITLNCFRNCQLCYLKFQILNKLGFSSQQVNFWDIDFQIGPNQIYGLNKSKTLQNLGITKDYQTIRGIVKKC